MRSHALGAFLGIGCLLFASTGLQGREGPGGDPGLRAQGRADALMTDARRLWRAGNDRAAFDSGLRALGAVKAAKGSSDAAFEALSFLKGILSGLTLYPENDGQSGDPKTGLPNPLVVRIQGGENRQPSPGWPLTFAFVGTQGQLTGKAVSDAEGKASCRVLSFTKNGETLRVAARMDESALLAGLPAGDADRANLARAIQQRGVVFNANVVVQQAAVPVEIAAPATADRKELSQIVISGKWQRADLVKIQQTLAQIGYNVSGEVVQMTPDWKTKLEPDTRWLVMLDSEVLQLSDVEGMTIAQIRATVSLNKRDSVSSTASKYAFSCETKGGGLDGTGAIHKAMVDAAGKIAVYIKTDFP